MNHRQCLKKKRLQLFIETQKLTIEEGDWLDMLWHMALEENGCHHNPPGDIRISEYVEDEGRLPLFMEQEADHLGWMEDDLEEEWERKYRSPNSYHDSSSSSTEDHRRLQEDLLAEWLQIEAELEASDIVQPARSSMGIHENIDMKAEAAIAEWQSVEGSEEAEWRLDDMISQLSTDVIFGDHQRDDSIRDIISLLYRTTRWRTAGRTGFLLLPIYGNFYLIRPPLKNYIYDQPVRKHTVNTPGMNMLQNLYSNLIN